METSAYGERNISRSSQKRKRFLEENGVSPDEAMRLCVLNKDKLIRLIVNHPTKTNIPELEHKMIHNISNATPSGQSQRFTKPHGAVPNISLTNLPKERRNSRWDTNEKLQCQANRKRHSFGFDSTTSSANNSQQFQTSTSQPLLRPSRSFAETSSETLSANRSSGWNFPEKTINEDEPVDLMVQPIAILLRDFPRSKLTCSQMEKIEETIVDKVLLAEDMKPQFYGTTYEAGYLAMHCCNSVTSEWIKKIISSIKPWPSAHMFATEEDKVPYPKVVVGKFLTSADLPTEVIVDNIKHQNAHLHVDHWQVIARKNDNTTAMLALSIDRISAAKLEGTKNRISFRLVQVILHFEDGDAFNSEPNL